MTNFNIQIISDTVCPWCYVGYRRLSRAITAHKTSYPTDTFSLTWRAFYLNPASPGFPGVDKQEAYKLKFGAARTEMMQQRLASVGEADGIAFKFGGKTGSTRDSHRLLWYAHQQEQQQEKTTASTTGAPGGLQTRVVENLFRAYFEEELNITDPAVLADAAVKAGLGRDEVEKVLREEVGGQEVDREAKSASQQLVSGVPYFTIQGKYIIEGADEPESFLEAFERVKQDE
ncbi:thioredoxin [Penicillium riverlandense]|uniref:thioredoxin n=1 Tax=Penicillium riverlandense TaxID=1903569 RepID=UPI00254824E4|nr:thioredoxin [Penicillium riverlandense]KAJ5833111.1 thioredoxin [Penicillium riverlandense]